MLTFISELHKSPIDEEKLNNFKKLYYSDDNYRKKVNEQIMIFNDRFIRIEKSKISANLFKALIEQDINYEEFVSLNISLNEFHLDAIPYLVELSKMPNFRIPLNPEAEGLKTEEVNKARSWDMETFLESSGIARDDSTWYSGFKVTEAGQKLFRYGIEPSLK